MKPAVFALTVALMTAVVSLAADTQVPQRQKSQRSGYSLKSSAYFMGRYSKNLSDMIDAALKMKLTAEQKSQVSAISGKYSDQMTRDESDVRKLRVNIPKMLNDPSFDPAKVKAEIDKANALEKKISDDYVDALASLRDTIGKENYQTLTKALYKYRNDLVQMRKDRQTLNRQPGLIKSEPA
ncbi:MAG TPA: periplasmic heavy metal sensor, partial [Thermodesulfobacteriota bacterium]|nr:periplasmic heavy metal sensor [Thermodesulfobacteriota bacterium]